MSTNLRMSLNFSELQRLFFFFLNSRVLLPGAALTGGVMVVLCDAAGRVLLAPSEIPAGVIMALLGAPFFLWLLRRTAHDY